MHIVLDGIHRPSTCTPNGPNCNNTRRYSTGTVIVLHTTILWVSVGPECRSNDVLLYYTRIICGGTSRADIWWPTRVAVPAVSSRVCVCDPSLLAVWFFSNSTEKNNMTQMFYDLLIWFWMDIPAVNTVYTLLSYNHHNIIFW